MQSVSFCKVKKIMLQIIIGAVFWTAFAIPVFEGVLNIGNITGMTVFGCVFLYGIFRKKLKPLFKKFRSKKAVKVITNIFCILFICFSAYAVILSGMIIFRSGERPPADVDTVIVLGCKVNEDGSPSTTLKMRLNKTAELLENNSAMCIVSGGKGRDEIISEAECMKNYLVSCGIDESRIIVEDKATSTKENIKYSLALIGEKPDRCALVTSNYHCLRAKLIAKEEGLKTYSVPTFSPREMLATYIARELFAIPYELIFR